MTWFNLSKNFLKTLHLSIQAKQDTTSRIRNFTIWNCLPAWAAKHVAWGLTSRSSLGLRHSRATGLMDNSSSLVHATRPWPVLPTEGLEIKDPTRQVLEENNEDSFAIIHLTNNNSKTLNETRNIIEISLRGYQVITYTRTRVTKPLGNAA